MLRHYVYKITNKLNGKFYIGIHSSTKDFLDTKYFGSGNLIIAAIKKYGRENFDREILYECDSRESVANIEEKIVSESIVKNRDSYNISIGGSGKLNQARVKIKSINKDNKITIYDSIKDASDSTGIHYTNICAALKKQRKHAGNLCWAYLDDPIIWDITQKPRNNRKECKSISACGEIKFYESAYNASKLTGISQKHICECINKQRKTAGGLSWFSKDDTSCIVHKSGCQVRYLGINANQSIIFDSLKAASAYANVRPSAICNAAKRKNGTAGGFSWKKVDI